MLRRIGTMAGLVGSGSGLVGSLWNLLLPAPDANIGAGALVVTGLLLALGGAALIGLRVLVSAPRAGHPGR